MKNAILSHISPEYPWKDLFCWFPELDSTNDRLKILAPQGVPHGTALMAARQTGGHGRRGRSFQSTEGGIYLSVLLRPDCAPTELMHLTCAVAVAMCDAVEQATGLRPGIKWTNDLVHGKKKLGGILTELGLSPASRVDYAILGIGINCCQKEADFAPELRSMAASLSMVTETEQSLPKVAAAMLDAIAKMDASLLTGKEAMMAQYRRDCITLGQEISLVRGDEVRHGTAVDLDADGALIVRNAEGRLETVSSGEVSVRGMYGYV